MRATRCCTIVDCDKSYVNRKRKEANRKRIVGVTQADARNHRRNNGVRLIRRVNSRYTRSRLVTKAEYQRDCTRQFLKVFLHMRENKRTFVRSHVSVAKRFALTRTTSLANNPSFSRVIREFLDRY